MALIETTLNEAQVHTMEKLLAGSYAVSIGQRSEEETRHIAVPVHTFPENAIIKVFDYGIQRIFNDKVGGLSLDAAETKVRARVAEFAEGKIRKSRTSGEKVSDLAIEVRRMILVSIKASLSKEAWKALSEEERADKADEQFEAQSEKVQADILAKAQANLDKKAKERADKLAAEKELLGAIVINLK